MNQESEPSSSFLPGNGESAKPSGMPKPDVSKMGYNPANFAYWIGEEPWVPGYSVYYAISFYDARAKVESERSDWWGPKPIPRSSTAGSV